MPDGSPTPSVVSTEDDPVGIQVGTVVATRRARQTMLLRRQWARHLWKRSKRADMPTTAEAPPGALHDDIVPVLPLGLLFVRAAVSAGWFDWPALPELFPASFPGVKTSRDGFLVDTDLDRLKTRPGDYFDLG